MGRRGCVCSERRKEPPCQQLQPEREWLCPRGTGVTMSLMVTDSKPHLSRGGVWDIVRGRIYKDHCFLVAQGSDKFPHSQT